MTQLSCPTCKAALSKDSKFCSNCGTKIDPSKIEQSSFKDSKYAERKQLTVLFSDLADSTQLSGVLDPEDMRDILREYQTVCSSVIKSHDGYVAKYLGDGILAYFGYPESHEGDAKRSVSAGLAMLEAMKAYSKEFLKKYGVRTDVRVGIHTGLVVVGDMGGAEYLESDAIVGQAPNLAARIQSLAELNTVYISSSTYKLLGVDFECKDLGFHELKGIPEPIQVYQALHEHTGASRLEVFSSNLTPFTGREKEMEILNDRWHLSAAGKGQVVVVNGEAGIGKSRIVHAMKEFNAAQKDSWLTEIRCSQFYSNSSFYPVIDMIERVVLNITKEDTPEDRLLKLEEWSAQYGTNESLVPLMASLLSIPLSDKYSPLNLTPVKQKEKTINTLVSFMLKRAKVQPVLFIAEDLHWADPSTLELLNKFIERSAGTRIFSVFTHRPAFTHSWDKHKHVERINLDRLSEKESKKVVFNVTGHKRIPEDAIDYILKKTDGIPLFLEELTGMMIEEEMFTEAGGRYELSQPINMLAVPNTLNDLLAARLDRMKEAKPVAQLASAIGREFSLSMLENIPGEHQINLQEKLQKLLDAGLLYEKKNSLEKEYVFKHALIQDSAYASLLRNSKRTYHNAIANSLIKHRPDIVEAKPELIANHFSKADDASTAMTFWQKAGQLAIQKSAMPEAISHLTKAVEESSKMPQSP